MAKMRKVKRSIATAVLVWVGRRMLGRVQKQTLKSVTRKPKSGKGSKQPARKVAAVSRLARFARSKPNPVVATKPSKKRRRTAQGVAFALLSAAAVAALKVGVEHVIESEREQQVVTPDFDVFADDDE